ncbi:hypothetical protein MPSEU_000211900 [Mayamaea pseudoterrestris]|nr:hypothetical protein MPSEU_000211900 [Mayamaea pseudoterrestris]
MTTELSLNSKTLLSNGLGSAAAGIIGRCLTHPLDTGKAKLQASSSPKVGGTPSQYTGTFQVLRTTFLQEGIRGWYRGFGVVVTLGTPGTVLYLSTYEIAKERLLCARASQSDDMVGLPDWAVHLASGMLAETIACVVYVPVDVIKERMQVQQRLHQQGNVYYKNTVDAMKQISQTEGLRGLYRGYAATLMSFGPFSALYFVFYERCKMLAREYEAHGVLSWEHDALHATLPTADLSFQSTLICSAGAGAAASWVTSPLDLAKLRLQVSRSQQQLQTNASPAYRGVFDCLRQAFRQGGIRGLFRGALARVLHFAPATTVTMTAYESCRSVISQMLHDDEI